jgi:AmiR/NasT family two-component response regulator
MGVTRAVERIAIFATLGALAWSNVVRTHQFREALNTRDMIGQAKGILIERYDLDDQTAFNTLTKLSQSMNTPLRDIARRVIEDATGAVTSRRATGVAA